MNYTDMQENFIQEFLHLGKHPIYKNNLMSSYVKILRDAYPVTFDILGEDCFSECAKEFGSAHPLQNSYLESYGYGFAEFLQSMINLPYLGDMARLEWLMRLAEYAADKPNNLASLANLSQDLQGDVVLHLLPSVQIMSLQFSVVAIWNWHQQPVEQRGLCEVDLTPFDRNVIVWRDNIDYLIHVEEISGQMAKFLEQVKFAVPLQVLSCEQHNLQEAASRGWINDWTLVSGGDF